MRLGTQGTEGTLSTGCTHLPDTSAESAST